MSKTTKVLKDLKVNSYQVKNPIATEMYLPNHSGDHSAGKVNTTPVNDTDLVNKSYVDSQDSTANTHITSDGSDHGFIDQDVTISATPTHASLTLTNQLVLKDNVEMRMGTGTDATFDWSTNQSNNSLVMGVGNTSNTLILTKVQNRNKDHGHGNQVHPTLFVHSEKDPDTANDEWISIGHDSNNGIISVGSGIVEIPGINLRQAPIYFGNTDTARAAIQGNVSREWIFGVGSDFQRALVLTDRTNLARNHDHGTQTNPTLFIHSLTNPDTANDEWTSFTHDQTNGVYDIGSGDHIFIGGDLSFTGDGTGLKFTEISANNVSSTITITSSGKANKVQITSFDTDGLNNGMTPDHTNDHITVVTAGMYLCTISLHVESTGAGGADIFGFSLYKNNGATEFSNVHGHRKLSGGGGDVGSISLSGIIDLAVDDTIELWCWNEDSTANIVIDDVTLSLTMIGGT